MYNRLVRAVLGSMAVEGVLQHLRWHGRLDGWLGNLSYGL
jgi:hypothetical protein